tara:strand:+ start:14982 stop:18152 length:3171 start_codon:yes stop_codon:yes gene_type:complete
MAYNRTYYFDIRSNNNISYRLEIYDDVETSALDKEGTLGTGGVKIKYGSEGSKMFAPLKPSTLTIDMMVTDIDAANYIKNLKTNRQERDVYVGLYRETVSGTNDPIYGPMWGGYLLMDLSADPDEALPYNIKLKCIDGLASLKHYDFIPDTLDQTPEGLYDIEDTYISNSQPNHRNFIDLISICLGNSGYFSTTQGSPHTPHFKTAVNWYNGEMANTTLDPLANTRCKPEIFYQPESQENDTIKYKAMNCYDVLVAICKAWGMRCFLWRNSWYFIQINQFEENQSGTQLNADDINNFKYNMSGSYQSTSDTIEQWWGMYQLYVENTQAATNVRNYKLAGGQYGTLPAFKKVTVDFLNVDNYNSFTAFPPIPLTSTSGEPTTGGTFYEFTSLGNFTFNGTTDRQFYQRIYLAITHNGTQAGNFETNYGIFVRPAGTGTNTANTSPYNNGWTKYIYWDTSTNEHIWQDVVTGYNAAAWEQDAFPIVPGNQTIDITTGTNFQTLGFPAATFTAGDWEIGYYVSSSQDAVNLTIWGGHGKLNWYPGPLNTNPWTNNIASQNVAYGYGIGSSEFAEIVNGAVGSYSTTTSLVQTGDDTADEKINNILFGDGFGGRGQVQIYTGSNWKDSDESGVWGIDTLAGNNSMSQQLAIDVFSAQSKSLVEFNVATTLDPTESIYFNDGTANRPQFICPFTKIIMPSDTASSTPTRAYIMHTGEWNVIQDTWKWKLYEQMQSLGSTTTTTNTNGGLNSGGTGGAGIPVPTGGGAQMRIGNPALNNTINTRLLLQRQIAPITTIRAAQQIAATGTYQQTITSLTVDALENILNAGDKFVLQTQSVDTDNTPSNRIEFEVSTKAAVGATTILVTSKTIYQNILIGDTLTFNTSDLVSQYQNKTEGTIAGMPVTSNTIGPIQYSAGRYVGDFDEIKGVDLNFIPILPSDFTINDDVASPAQFKDAATTGLQVSNASSELIAFIRIPTGKKAQYVDVFGTNPKVVQVYEMQVDASNNLTTATDLAGGTGVMNTRIILTSEVSSTATNYLLIIVKLTATSNRIWGGKVTIADI